MPIYEYSCQACGRQIEAFQKMSEAPLVECPECHKPALTKLISAAGFQLKGTGWYATDFKNKGKAPSTQTESKNDSSSTDGKSGTSGDQKTNNS